MEVQIIEILLCNYSLLKSKFSCKKSFFKDSLNNWDSNHVLLSIQFVVGSLLRQETNNTSVRPTFQKIIRNTSIVNGKLKRTETIFIFLWTSSRLILKLTRRVVSISLVSNPLTDWFHQLRCAENVRIFEPSNQKPIKWSSSSNQITQSIDQDSTRLLYLVRYSKILYTTFNIDYTKS